MLHMGRVDAAGGPVGADQHHWLGLHWRGQERLQQQTLPSEGVVDALVPWQGLIPGQLVPYVRLASPFRLNTWTPLKLSPLCLALHSMLLPRQSEHEQHKLVAVRLLSDHFSSHVLLML